MEAIGLLLVGIFTGWYRDYRSRQERLVRVRYYQARRHGRRAP